MQALMEKPHGLTIVTTPKWDDLKRRIQKFDPKSDMGMIVKACFRHLPVDLAQEMLDTIERCVIVSTQLELIVHRHPDSPYRHGGPTDEYLGVVSRRLVTTAGVVALCAAWASSTFNMKYMSLGTTATSENITDVQMAVEITTNHYTSSVRPTCSVTPTTNTVLISGTHTQATAGDTINEHGIASSATPAAVTLWDRSLTGAQTLSVADAITGNYTLTATAGG